MLDRYSRLSLIVGDPALETLSRSTVAIFGIGGVGSWAAEALARSGVGSFILVDDDSVCLTNINRQLIALQSTIGKPKVEVMRDRILDINPSAAVTVYEEFYGEATADKLLAGKIDYIVDAIDTVSSKLDLITRAKAGGIPVISALGAGNKLDPTRFEVADIAKTSVCPLARVIRQELKKRRIRKLKVVYSKETPLKVNEAENPCRTHCVCPKKDRTCAGRRSVPGSAGWVTPVMGLIIAGEVVKDLTAAL